MTTITQTEVAATDAAASAAFDMVNAARRIEGRLFLATNMTMDDGPAHEAYKNAIRATNAAQTAYEAIRAVGATLRGLGDDE